VNKDELHLMQKVNSIDSIEAMRIIPKEESQFFILLCCLLPMPIVHLCLGFDIKRLEVDFTYGYRPSSSIFYVFICNEKGETQNLSTDDRNCLSPKWKLKSEEFDAKL